MEKIFWAKICLFEQFSQHLSLSPGLIKQRFLLTKLSKDLIILYSRHDNPSLPPRSNRIYVLPTAEVQNVQPVSGADNSGGTSTITIDCRTQSVQDIFHNHVLLNIIFFS